QGPGSLIDHPDHGFAPKRLAEVIAHPYGHVDLLTRACLLWIIESHGRDVLYWRNGDPVGRRDGDRLALIEGRSGARRTTRQAPAHDQEMHRQFRHLFLAQGHGITAKPVGDFDPIVTEATFGLLDDREGPCSLERALDDQRHSLAGCVALLVRRHYGGLRWRTRPGHRRRTADKEVDADLLSSADA